MHKKAFTLVELIVVITILAVLATVAFVSFQGYAVSSRDSARLADLASMEKVLELYNIKNSKYPNPDSGTNITYSGSTAWTQGVFGTLSYSNGASMSNVPVDPVTGLEYPYSRTVSGKEYSIATILEQPVSSKLTNNTFAGTQEAEVLVKGNYNGKFLKVRKNTTTYILGVPSIIASDITDVRLETILPAQDLVYNGFKNLPASFSGSVYDTNPTVGFDFAPAKLILFEGDIQDLKDNQSTRITFLENLQTNYAGSPIVSETSIAEILAVDSNSPAASSNYVATALNNSLKSKIPIIPIENNCNIIGKYEKSILRSEEIYSWIPNFIKISYAEGEGMSVLNNLDLCNSTDIILNNNIIGATTNKDSRAIYKISFEYGYEYNVNLTSDYDNIEIIIHNSNGILLEGGLFYNNGVLKFTPIESGIYYVSVIDPYENDSWSGEFGWKPKIFPTTYAFLPGSGHTFNININQMSLTRCSQGESRDYENGTCHLPISGTCIGLPLNAGYYNDTLTMTLINANYPNPLNASFLYGSAELKDNTCKYKCFVGHYFQPGVPDTCVSN